MEVPLPRAASRRLISFLTFQISMFFSASLGCSFFPDDMAAVVLCECAGWVSVGSRDFLAVQRGASKASDVASRLAAGVGRGACYAALDQCLAPQGSIKNRAKANEGRGTVSQRAYAKRFVDDCVFPRQHHASQPGLRGSMTGARYHNH